MRSIKLYTKYEKGISLIELILVLVAIAVLAILVTSLPSSIQSIRNSGNTSQAREIASKQLDYLRQQPYTNLINGINSFSDINLSKLPSPTAEYDIENCPSEVCTQGEVAKQIRITISWVEGGNVKKLELSTLVTQEGWDNERLICR